jgi:hypothetical protein
MATWDDVREAAESLPDVISTSGATLSWRVHGKTFVWERPLRNSDMAALGPAGPNGEILAVHTDGESGKLALIADSPDIYFTIPHFNGYPAVLIRLEAIDPVELGEVITDAWLIRAPQRIARAYLATHPGRSQGLTDAG